jgi:hypothetical protein
MVCSSQVLNRKRRPCRRLGLGKQKYSGSSSLTDQMQVKERPDSGLVAQDTN